MIAYPHIAGRLLNTPLLMHPGKLSALLAGLGHRFGVEPIPSAYASPPTAGRGAGDYRRVGRVAVIEAFGALVHRTKMQADSTYLQGYDDLSAKLTTALNDSAVSAIVMVFDSPGGEVSGAFQLAEQIHQARAKKPIYAAASDLAASAAYLLAAATGHISLSTTAMVGSIGVALAHTDISQALEKAGVVMTTLYAGAHKIDGTPYQPLPPSVAADLQATVDQYYTLFLEGVARYRTQTPVEVARATEARTYIGVAALTAQLADRIETADQLIARISAQYAPKKTSTVRGSKMTASLHDTALLTDEPELQEAPLLAIAALSPMAISKLCLAAGEADLMPVLLSEPHTEEQVQQRIVQAKEVRKICALTHCPEMASGLVSTGASADEAKVITWNAMVARDQKIQIDTTPPLRTSRQISRAQFEALSPQERHDFIRNSGCIAD